MIALGFTAVVKLAKGVPWTRWRQMLLPSATVDKVKQWYRLNETSFTNGPQGMVSYKTQISLQLLSKEMGSFTNNIQAINPAYEELVNLTKFVDDPGGQLTCCVSFQARVLQCPAVRPRFQNNCEWIDEENNEMVRQVLRPWPILLPGPTKQ